MLIAYGKYRTYETLCKMNPLVEGETRGQCSEIYVGLCRSEGILDEVCTLRGKDSVNTQSPFTDMNVSLRMAGNGLGCGSLLHLLGNGVGDNRIQSDGRGCGDGSQRGHKNGNGCGYGNQLSGPGGGNGPLQRLFFP